MAGGQTTRAVCARLLLAACGSALAIQGLAGCASKHDTNPALNGIDIPPAFVRTAPFDPGDRPVSEPVLMAPRSTAQPARLVWSHQLQATPPNEATEPSVIGPSVGELHRVKLSVSEARLPEVLHALIGPDGLGKSYVIDPTIMKSAQTVTMDIDEEMTTQDMRELLSGLGRMFGWTIQETGDAIYIRATKDVAKNPTSPVIEAMAAIGDQSPVIRVRRMKYVAPADLSKLLEGMLSEGGLAVPVGRQIVILDTAANANRIARLLAALDVPSFNGVEIWTYRLANRTPDEAKTLLDAITAPTKLGGGNAQDPVVAYVALPDTQKIMVISRDPTAQSYVQDLLSQVDQPPDSPARNRYVYRIQYYDPASLLNLINSFFSDRVESSGGIGGAGAVPGGGGTPVAGGPAKVPAGTGIRLTLDPKEDLLLIQATPDDYADLLATLRMVDRPRQQVELTSIIAEVRLSNDLEYGVEYFLQALDQKGLGILELAGGASDLLTGTPTASAFFTGADGFAIIKALQRVSDVSILQEPHLTVMDGATATLQVGGETPYPKGTLATDTGAVQSATDYKQTGLTLTIVPKINESGDVTLHITQDITNVLGQTDLGPEFVTRKLETDVAVPHGNTLLLGGIIDTTQTKSARKIPLLGDVPGLGAAFQSKVDQDERNELLLAITPRIVNTPAEGQRTMGEFMMAARGLQRAMYENAASLPPGVLNPTVRQREPAVRTDAPPPKSDKAPDQTRPPGLEKLPPQFLKELERRSDASPLGSESGPVGAWALGGPLILGPSMQPAMPAFLMSW